MFGFGKKKKKAQEQKKQQLPAENIDESSYDQWIDHTKPPATNPPVDEGTYDNWIDDGKTPSNPQVEDEYDDWSMSNHHLQKPEQLPKVEDLYDDFVETKTEDVGNQEYEEVEGEGDIFGFDNKRGASKHTATSPSWVNKPPQVKGAPPSTKKAISMQTPQDEYEDVMGEGDIFGFDDKKGSKATSPSWANKAPPVKGIPPSSKRPISMQQRPNVLKNHPPSERPRSEQSPTYINFKEAEPYEMPVGQNYINVNQQVEAGESYEEMEDLNLKPTYMNVTSQDAGGESYEEVDGLDLQSAAAAENGEYYEDILPDDRVQKPPITASIAERQQQLQKKETKEPPKKMGLAADYQKMKFEMLAQKFKEIDSGEPKAEPAKMTSDKKKATWPPKSGGNDETAPVKGTVTSLTRGFQGSGANKAKDKVNMKGLLWHKPPGRSKYHEEHCELEGNNLKLFRNKKDPKPYFTINTTQCELASAPEEYEKKNVFKLTAGASRDYFGAFNVSEMRAWMDALRPVVKTAK